jgi:hypothetical protein
MRKQNGCSLRCSRSHISDRASVRAATRVNAEQSSHEQMGVKWVFLVISLQWFVRYEVLSPLA